MTFNWLPNQKALFFLNSDINTKHLWFFKRTNFLTIAKCGSATETSLMPQEDRLYLMQGEDQQSKVVFNASR